MTSPIPFGATPAGATKLFTLETPALRVGITDYGARMVSIESPDRAGVFGNVLLGFDAAEAYDAAGGSFGAILGRYANRIAAGRFTLDGVRHQLATNDPGGTLHGGPEGFARKLWTVEHFDREQLALGLTSPDGDQGFPGTLTVRVVYRIAGDTLRIDLSATTDAPTICNLSSHPYFNLAGAARHDVLAHEVTLNASTFLPTDDAQIPTGEVRAVADTAFDFRTPAAIGARIREADPQLLLGRGYDHCFVLNGAGERFAAAAYDPASGRRLEVFTTQPGLQFYSGNSLNGSIAGRGVAFRQSAGFAFEAQNFPDAPNHAEFPSAALRPGETYRRRIAYRFLVS